MVEAIADSAPFLARFGLKPAWVGKVRDTYDLGDWLLMVTTDRISAFDVVLPSVIPGKGAVLTQLSAFWFEKIAPIVPNHFIRLADGTVEDELPFLLPPELVGRTMIARKALRIDIECVVRGYLAGSGWTDYQASGQICGVKLPLDLRESDQLPDGPIFTPTTKVASGHDENIDYKEVSMMVGSQVAGELFDKSEQLYRFATGYAHLAGIIIADTKFEFGWTLGGRNELIVIDELLTPDSSRFWLADRYKPGGPQPSLDKQPVRDWLTASGWNKEPPAPTLPPDVVAATAERYREIFSRLTGREVAV